MGDVVELPKKKPYCIVGCYCANPEGLRVTIVAEILPDGNCKAIGLTCPGCGYKAEIEDGVIKEKDWVDE